MYYINIVDKKGNRVNILKKEAEVEIDNFTTCFTNPNALLKKLNLSTDMFYVEIVKDRYVEKQKSFADSSYRYFVKKFKNIGNKKFINCIINISDNDDRQRLKDYFLNENFNNLSKDKKYEKEQIKRLNKIRSLLSNNPDNIGNSKLENLYQEELSDLITDYLKIYGKYNYSSCKKIYKFLMSTGKNYKPIFDDKDKEYINNEIDIINNSISIYISSDSNSFIDGNISLKNKITKNDENSKIIDIDDDVDYENNIINNDFIDIDKKMTELDMFLDEKKLTCEDKYYYKEKNKGKIFK